MNSIESELKHLPDPAVPEELAASISARIARLDEEQAAPTRESPRVAVAQAGRDRLALALAFLGATVGLGAQAYRLAVGEVSLDLLSPRISGGLDGIVEILPVTPALAVLAAGILLYLTGLFVPMRETDPAG